MRGQPEVAVHYKPAIVRPGDEVTVDIDIQSRTRTPVEQITVTLSGKEVFDSSYLQEKERSCLSLVATFPAAILTPGSHTRSALFRIPKDAPYSRAMDQEDIGATLKIEYELLVEIAIPWWPDLGRRFAFFVAPPELGEAEPTRRVEGLLGAETWLDRSEIRAGDTLSGHLNITSLELAEAADIRVHFVAELAALVEQPPRRSEVATFRSPSIRRVKAREPMAFEVVLPRSAPASFEGRFCRITWTVEIHVEVGQTRGVVAKIPIQVLDPGDDWLSLTRGSELVHLGAERRLALWSEVAREAGLVFDRESDRMTLDEEGARLAISIEQEGGEDSVVARMTWRHLGMDLRIEPRTVGDILRERLETGNVEVDKRLQIVSREPAQGLSLLTPEVQAALAEVAGAVVDVDDAGAGLWLGGNGRDRATLRPFVAGAAALAKAISRAGPNVPFPAALARFEGAWRAATGRLGGRLSPGGPYIFEGKWGDATVEMGLSWEPGGVVRGTAFRLYIEPPLPSAVDPEAPGARLSKRGVERVKALAEKLTDLVLGPDRVEGLALCAALDPDELLDVFDEIGAVAAALEGRFEGPYR